MLIIPRRMEISKWAKFGIINGLIHILFLGVIIGISAIALFSFIDINLVTSMLGANVDILVPYLAGSLALLFVSTLLTSVVFWTLGSIIYYFIKSAISSFSNFWQMLIVGTVLTIVSSLLMGTLGMSIIMNFIFLGIDVLITLKIIKFLGLKKYIPIN